MSKKLIAGAGIVAALGVIALPLGAFAANSWSETVSVTVQSACNMTTDGSTGASDTTVTLGTVTNGNIATASGTSQSKTYKVVCNSAHGWTLTAVGSGSVSGDVTKMAGSTGTDIATGTKTSGTAGSWAMKVTKSGSGIATGTYGSFKAVPSTATEVLKATGATDATTGEFTTDYQVYIGTQTPAGTYTGKVTYTLAEPNS